METIEQQFQQFYENIKLTKAQRKDAMDKYDGVCQKLHDCFYPNTSYTGNTKLLIGSYGKHTSIRPARDVDVVFIMPPEKFSRYDDNTSNKQSQLLQDIKEILKEKYPITPIKAFGKVVVLEFSETRHNIEVVPAWENSDGTFCIPNSENGGSWEIVRYREEIKSVLDSDSRTGKTKFLIRVVKKWANTCSVGVRSFQIEQAVISFFNNESISNWSSAALVKSFFEYFLRGAHEQNLRSHLQTACNRSSKAFDFEQQGKLNDATIEWRKVFGDIDFPKNTKIEIVANKYDLDRLQKQYPSSSEEFLDIDHGIPFELNSSFTVSVDADVSNQNGYRDSLLSAYLARKFPVQKKKKLVFRIKHNVPYPYRIMWKIRNFGEEASRVDGGLRGQIYPDVGLESREESTKYYGEHYVECYIIKDDKCVAVGRIFVPIGNNY